MTDSREVRQQELARRLLQKARQDLTLLIEVSASTEIADEIFGFHAQQAVEKAIKAVLTRIGIQYEYTHDLALLYQQVEQAQIELPVTLDAVDELTSFAVQFRYTLYETEQSFDRDNGIELAEKIVEWADTIVERPVHGTAR